MVFLARTHTHTHTNTNTRAMNSFRYECAATTVQYHHIISHPIIILLYVLCVKYERERALFGAQCICIAITTMLYMLPVFCNLNIRISIIIKYGIGCWRSVHVCGARKIRIGEKDSRSSSVSRNKTISTYLDILHLHCGGTVLRLITISNRIHWQMEARDRKTKGKRL